MHQAKSGHGSRGQCFLHAPASFWGGKSGETSKHLDWDFPGGPVIKTLGIHCRGWGTGSTPDGGAKSPHTGVAKNTNKCLRAISDHF